MLTNDQTKLLQVSGSIVAYKNSPAQIAAAIRSFASGSISLAVTVIDNSPTDGLRDIVAEAGAEYCFNGHNAGFGAGHNVAIRKYSGASEYHLILNPDVSFGSEVLQALYQFMQRNPDVGLVMPRVLYPGGEEQGLCKLLPTPSDLLIRRFGGPLGRSIFRAKMDRYLLRGVDLTTPRVVPSLSGCCMLIRTSLFQKVGVFDERYFLYMEDVDLCRRIGEVSKTMYFPDVAVYHEYQKGSYHNWLLTKYHVKSAWEYFSKWGWFVDRTRDRLNQNGS
ncbi:MAG TPA: glycosyltransferase family 2 protein [Candidatus Angelobacter sp.]|jgi:GT2 family glycosyltransferase|nr:glycosyltransferase family 2 protein [Candidatus Angelobacter sp.]